MCGDSPAVNVKDSGSMLNARKYAKNKGEFKDREDRPAVGWRLLVNSLLPSTGGD